MNSAAIDVIDIFEGLPAATLENLLPRLRRVRVGASQYVFSMSHTHVDVYFLLEGTVRVCAFSEAGKQVQFEDLLKGQMFGEMAAIDGAPRSGDCVALEDCDLAVISGKDFNDVLEQHPEVASRVMKRLVSMVRNHMSRVYEFSTSTVRQRVRYELLRMASLHAGDQRDIVITDPPTHADIAARISTHREAVTREVKSLESKGLITWRRGKHVIHDVVGLTTFER